MKKLLLFISLCIFSLGVIHAEITWTLSDDGTLTISGTDMPDYSYAPWYFQRNKIKEVVIKDGVTSIGEAAFKNCSSLTSVTIPNSVTSIGYGAFYGTKWYDNQPDGVVYAGKVLYAYKGTMPLNTKIDIKDGTKGIVDYAFYACFGLTSVTIPNSVTSIGERAFSDCSGLTSITIPNSVTSIESSAFKGCSGLTSLTIPNSVKSIGSYAFKGTKWYDNQPDGVVYAGKVLYAYKGTMPSNSKIEIKEGTTEIAYDAFRDCSGLTSLTIPNSVTSIGESAFSGCSGLTSVTIPNSVTSIGGSAFSGCSGLTSVTIPNSVTSIGYSAFYGCSGLTSITIPNAVTSIGSSAFFGCSDLTSVTIPNAVTSIGEEAFYGCSGLTSLTIGNSVTSIGYWAFYDCSDLTSLTIPNSVTRIGSKAFYNAKLKTIVIKAKTPPSWDKTEHNHGTFCNQTLYHAILMVPEGSWDAYAYNDEWYQFINIREVAYNADKLTNSKAYMLKSSNEGSYLFYDSVNDCVATLNETALDDTEENNTWMTTEVEGKHYVYNLGAKKFLVADKANAKTGYRLSDVPASIDIEDGKDAIVFGKSKEFYMVINDKLNVDENLESLIMTTTGIKSTCAEANQPTVTYNVNGQIVPDNAKGLFIKNGKKIIIK